MSEAESSAIESIHYWALSKDLKRLVLGVDGRVSRES